MPMGNGCGVVWPNLFLKKSIDDENDVRIVFGARSLVLTFTGSGLQKEGERNRIKRTQSDRCSFVLGIAAFPV